MKKANAYKCKGTLVFRSSHTFCNLFIQKRAVYDFTNWTTFLVSLATCLITNKIFGLTFDGRVSAMVVDDTLYSRLRSKLVELLANVHDHAGKGPKFRHGFRLLTLAWTDGATQILLLFKHLSSVDKKNRYNEINSNIDKRSCGYKARLQAISTGPKGYHTLSLQLILRSLSKIIIKNGLNKI